MPDNSLRDAALSSKAWPYEEARKLLKRWPEGKPAGDPMIFETGYGPSGLPHIGTFNEVARTSFVRHAYEELTGGAATRLIAFSDDMDGLRKVPDNVPNQAMLTEYLGKPLTKIPDPFGTDASFAHHNNAMLRHFLDRFGFDYEFVSATDCYTSGRFDEVIRKVLRGFDAIMGVMLPTLREDRRKTYSPVLPISPASGRVLQVPVDVVDAEAGLIAFDDEDGSRVQQSAFGGLAKLQWKVDWAARWVALGVDYEMAGKDLIDSVIQSGKICRILGGRPPEGFNYEMFLDEKGEKISKSKGNGLSLEEWLRYGSEPSLELLHLPRAQARQEPAPRSHPARGRRILAVPRQLSQAADRAEARQSRCTTSIAATCPTTTLPLTYGLLLNLVSLPGVADKDTAWRFVQRYAPGTSPESDPELDELIGLAVNYARDFVAPDTAAPRADRDGSRSAARPRFGARQAPARRVRRGHPDPGVRSRQAPPVRVAARLVPGALRNPARLVARPAHGQLHRALRHRQQPQADRRGSGERDRLGQQSRGAVDQRRLRRALP